MIQDPLIYNKIKRLDSGFPKSGTGKPENDRHESTRGRSHGTCPLPFGKRREPGFGAAPHDEAESYIFLIFAISLVSVVAFFDSIIPITNPAFLLAIFNSI